MFQTEMRMKPSRTALILSLAVAALSFAGTARADVTLRVDNYLNPSAYPYAASSDILEVCIHTEAISNPYQEAPQGWRCQSRVLGTISSAHDFSFVGGRKDAGRVTKVRLRIGGSNLFIVDEWTLIDPHGAYNPLSRGVDNDEGYCLSTNSNDFSNAHCWSGTNGPNLEWTMATRTLIL